MGIQPEVASKIKKKIMGTATENANQEEEDNEDEYWCYYRLFYSDQATPALNTDGTVDEEFTVINTNESETEQENAL